MARRQHKTAAQKKEEKRIYDQNYRAENLKLLKAKKHAYHKRTYDPAKAAIERKARMTWHVEYCRRPEYKRWKQGYDKQYRAGKFYGPFAEAAIALMDLNNEIKGRMDKHEIRYQNGQTNKAQCRRRQSQQEDRNRNSRRRAGDQAIVG